HIEEAAHWIMVEQTSQLNEYLGEYLENLKKIEETSQDSKKLPQSYSKL
ncbi:31559_t:CDS:1, partial [Racocetra persica]